MNQEKQIEKLKSDRDTALRITKSFSDKLKILAEHVCICGGRLAFKDADLSKDELKSLSEFMEVYE